MKAKPAFKTYLQKGFALYDGAMGTLLVENFSPIAGAGFNENCLDSLYLSKPELIANIHRLYLESGAQVIETNTFSSNPFKLKEYNLSDKVSEINCTAVNTALDTTREYFDKTGIPRYVAVSIGPSGYLISSDEPSLNNITRQELFDGYCAQIEPAIQAGADILLVETGQDLLEVKIITRAALYLKKKLQKDELFIQVQVTLDENGKMVLGSDITAVLAALEPFPIDALGINCSTGPAEMEPALTYLSSQSQFYVSCLPNAGIPRNVEGKAVYDLNPQAFADQLLKLARKHHIEIIGGCCGTTPEHIQVLADSLEGYLPSRSKGSFKPRLSSQFTAQSLEELPRPVIIGERLNAQGSKKARELLVDEQYGQLLDIARDQVSEDVYLLDVCTANNVVGKEGELMERLTNRLQSSIDAALVLDTTEEEVINSILPGLIGRGIINSIHLESREDKARRILKTAKEYGLMVIALAIDENGMALTAEEKLQVAEKMVRLADSTGFSREQLLFDPLVFSLATGQEKFRNSALETLESLLIIRRSFPQIHLSLGISNLSFGLMPRARKFLNAVFLQEAGNKGLDFAIYNPAYLMRDKDIPPLIKAKCLDLIYNRHPESLESFIAEFEIHPQQEEELVSDNHQDAQIRIKNAILKRNRTGIDGIITDILKEKEPQKLLHDILIPAMEEVGEKMSRGEIILPYVLQSAEIFKMILDKLAPYLPKGQETIQKKVLLATVYGDIHDIGKNLVKTLLKNSGYEVLDLGKQVPSETILERARHWKPDVIGLSALLVTTSRYMAQCVEDLARSGFKIPVIIGGAAVNEHFAEKISHISGNSVYAGGVYYAKDAFQGIKTIENILQ